MKISYNDEDDVLTIQFGNGLVVREESHGWNVNVAYLSDGAIESVTILEAREQGYWPIEGLSSLLKSAA